MPTNATKTNAPAAEDVIRMGALTFRRTSAWMRNNVEYTSDCGRYRLICNAPFYSPYQPYAVFFEGRYLDEGEWKGRAAGIAARHAERLAAEAA
jgi:hypothetical protein